MAGEQAPNSSAALREHFPTGLANPKDIEGFSGLEILQGMADGRLPAPPMFAHVPMLPEAVEHGHLIFRAWAGPEFANPMGLIHGGWFATVLDTALGLVVTSTCEPGEAAVSTDTSVRFLRPLPAKREHELIITATVEHRGRTSATSAGRVSTASGKLLATGTSAMAIMGQS